MLGKRVVYLVIVFFGLYLIANLLRNTVRLLGSEGRIEQARLETERLELEVEELKKQRDWYASQEFVEQQARNELGLAREGETIMVLPENLPPVYDFAEEEEKETTPVWQQWVELFL